MFFEIQKIVKEGGLVMVCEEVGCLNIGECWEQKYVIFMIFGDMCMCVCFFCNVKIGLFVLVDYDEVCWVVDVVAEMGFNYVVIILVDCDDFDDGGVQYFVDVINFIWVVVL